MQDGGEAPGAPRLGLSCCKLPFVRFHLELNKLWLKLSKALAPTGHLFWNLILLFRKFLLVSSLRVFAASFTLLSLYRCFLFTQTIPFLVLAAFHRKG